jgi:hypothetical protein
MKKRIVTGAAALLTAVAAVGSCVPSDDPASSTVPALYGPPEYFESGTVSDETTTTASDSGKNFVPTLYGPPEYFNNEEDDTAENEINTDNTAMTTAAPLYGPPEYFESISKENEINAADSKEKTE